jgi:uncharacterized membrane protein YcjF (UPF0283 family)
MSNHSECEELNLEATDPEWRFDPRAWERHQWLWLVSGLAAGLAVLVTLRTIYLHLRSFTNLVQQELVQLIAQAAISFCRRAFHLLCNYVKQEYMLALV